MQTSDALELLTKGDLEIVGRLVQASNATLLAEITLGDVSAQCVYKPTAGERPLWDYPHETLALREVAAFQVSQAVGWDVVPPTVLRDGPFGSGSVQIWIEDAELPGDGAQHGAGLVDLVPQTAIPRGWHNVLRAEDYDGNRVCLVHADDEALRDLATFDVVVDNADRKGAHILRDELGHLRGVDHGLTFNVETKHRTILWGWAGQPLRERDRERLSQLAALLEGNLGADLELLLSPQEVDVTRARVRRLLERDRMPRPSNQGPAIPWPPL